MSDRRFEPGKRVRGVVSDVKEGVHEGVDKVKHGVHEGVETVKHGVHEGVDKVKHGMHDRAEHLKQGFDAKLGHLWWAMLLRGLILGGLGLYAIFSPSAGLELMGRVVGLFLIASGAVGLFGAFSAKDMGEFLAQGLVDLVLGALLLIQPDFMDGAVVLVLGIWGLFTGGSLLWRSRKLERLDRVRGAMRAVGVVLSILGLVFLFWPQAGTVTLAWIIGAGALVAAAAMLFLASKLKGARSRLSA